MTMPWPKVPLKYLVSKIGSGKTPKGGAEVYTSSGVMLLRSQNVHFDGLRLDDVVYIDDEMDRDMASTRVQPNDVLLNITGASIGRCTVVPEVFGAANVNQHVCIIRPEVARLLPHYLNLVLQSPTIQDEIWFGENGSSREGLNFEQVGAFEISLPPLPVQQRIADQAQAEVLTVERLIQQKQHLLEALAEKRRALIAHAVTRGLNRAAPLRESGIEWLGAIPAHWEVVHLKRVLTEMAYGTSQSVNSEGAVGVLRMGDIREGAVDLSRLAFLDDVDNDLDLAVGDLLFNRTNSLDQIGKVALIRDLPQFRLSFASYLVRLRCSQRMNPEYMNFLLNSVYANAFARSEALPSIGQANLNPDRFSYLLIPLPPREEQEQIAKILTLEVRHLSALQQSIQKTLDLLLERRGSLIATAVNVGELSS